VSTTDEARAEARKVSLYAEGYRLALYGNTCTNTDPIAVRGWEGGQAWLIAHGLDALCGFQTKDGQYWPCYNTARFEVMPSGMTGGWLAVCGIHKNVAVRRGYSVRPVDRRGSESAA
jgi:hypothetical protein